MTNHKSPKNTQSTSSNNIPSVQCNGKIFPSGSLFSQAVSETFKNVNKNDDDDHLKKENATVIFVSKGTQLQIKKATLVLQNETRNGQDGITLHFASDENPDALALSTFMPSKGIFSDSLLGMNISGPRTLRFWVTMKFGFLREDHYVPGYEVPIGTNKVNVFGSVIQDPNIGMSEKWNSHVSLLPNEEENESKTLKQITQDTLTKQTNNHMDIEKTKKTNNDKKRPHDEMVVVQVQTNHEKDEATKYDKEHDNDKKSVNSETNAKSSEILRMERKARKKMAKCKREELQNVIAKQQGFETKLLSSTESKKDIDKQNLTVNDEMDESYNDKSSTVTSSKKKSKSNANTNANANTNTSMTKKPYSERRLAGGILVKDIIIGDGSQVKLGRRASILYTGSFPDGKVFDKNQNRRSPLQFRVGTGEVIRGLERGLEGMRVNGERTIVIPPHLGYGKKGSGKVIPKNSTLVFHVNLISVGGGA